MYVRMLCYVIVMHPLYTKPNKGGGKYRLSINNPAINILVTSVFRHEFQSAVSNFPSWHGLCFDGAVPKIKCLLMPDY